MLSGTLSLFGRPADSYPSESYEQIPDATNLSGVTRMGPLTSTYIPALKFSHSNVGKKNTVSYAKRHLLSIPTRIVNSSTGLYDDVTINVTVTHTNNGAATTTNIKTAIWKAIFLLAVSGTPSTTPTWSETVMDELIKGGA